MSHSRPEPKKPTGEQGKEPTQEPTKYSIEMHMHSESKLCSLNEQKITGSDREIRNLLNKKINKLEEYTKDAWKRSIQRETANELTREKNKVAEEILNELKELRTILNSDEPPTAKQCEECIDYLISMGKIEHQKVLKESLITPIKPYLYKWLLDALCPMLNLAGVYLYSGKLGKALDEKEEIKTAKNYSAK